MINATLANKSQNKTLAVSHENKSLAVSHENKTLVVSHASTNGSTDQVLENARSLLTKFDRKFEGYNSHATIVPGPKTDKFINWVN